MGAIAFIGVLLGFFIAKGHGADEGAKVFLQLHRHQWGDIHLYLSLAFLVFLVTHIILHWGWIKACTRRHFRSALALIAIVLLPALLILIAWCVSDKGGQGGEGHGWRGGKAHGGQHDGP